MKKLTFSIIVITLIACKQEKKDSTPTEPVIEASIETTPKKQSFRVTPISHATMVLSFHDKTIYVDPVGGKSAFEGQPAPDLILVTDIHGDHLNIETLQAVSTNESKLIVPQAVADKLPKELVSQVINNEEIREHAGFSIEAIPMYNLREEALKFHKKGRGNGYVIEKEGKRIYISGDTEDIPEMRALKNIDIAFVCMNLPYTMTIENAASAVLEFKPKTIYPYHYRGTEGLSDVNQFKSLIDNPNIEVIQLNWYPEKSTE